MKYIRHLTLLFILGIALLASGCETVRPWQKNLLNDQDMALKERKNAQYELNFQSYREGASGANGGKTGGGCGCN